MQFATARACNDRLELISRLLDEELTETERFELEHHLAHCEDCRATLDQLRLVKAASAVTAHAQRSPESLPPRTLARLREKGLIGCCQRHRRTSGFPSLVHMAGGAVIILAAASLLFLGHLAPPTESRGACWEAVEPSRWERPPAWGPEVTRLAAAAPGDRVVLRVDFTTAGHVTAATVIGGDRARGAQLRQAILSLDRALAPAESAGRPINGTADVTFDPS